MIATWSAEIVINSKNLLTGSTARSKLCTPETVGGIGTSAQVEVILPNPELSMNENSLVSDFFHRIDLAAAT